MSGPAVWLSWAMWVPGLAMAWALVVDTRWGEPPAWAHPVVAMGRYLGLWTARLCAMPPAAARLGGALVWWLGALLVLAFALSLDVSLASLLALLCWGDDPAPGATALATFALARVLGLGLLLKPLLSWRMLRDEVQAVDAALTRSLPDGRRQLARLVSRDVQALDATQVRESAIESLAENLNDSVVAPLWWFAVAGLPGAALYRYANTADAMWGYRDHRRWMGAWAARVDDVLSWWPARMSAVLLCAGAGRWPGLVRMRQEAARTPSPNGGWPMGTMALLLDVCLRKPGVYTLHANGRAPQSEDVVRALRWAGAAVGWTLAVMTLVATVPAMWPAVWTAM